MSRKQRRAASAAQRRSRAQQAKSAPTMQLTEAQLVVEFMASILKQAQSKAQVAFQVYNEARELLEGNEDDKFGLPEGHELLDGVIEARDTLLEAQLSARSDVLVAGLDLIDAIDAAELERDDPPRIRLVSTDDSPDSDPVE